MPANRKSFHHTDRINVEISRELTEILRTVKDPRVSNAFISITHTETTADLKYCKVFYSILSGDEKEVKAGLLSASGYIRKEIASRLNLRMTPSFTFIADNSIEHGIHISKLIDDVVSEKNSEESSQ